MNFFVVFSPQKPKKTYNMDDFFSAPCCNGFQIYKYLSALERFIFRNFANTMLVNVGERERASVKYSCCGHKQVAAPTWALVDLHLTRLYTCLFS